MSVSKCLLLLITSECVIKGGSRKTDACDAVFSLSEISCCIWPLSSHCAPCSSLIFLNRLLSLRPRDGTSRPWQGIWVPRSSLPAPASRLSASLVFCPLKYISRLYCRSLNHHYLTDQLTDSFPQGSGGVIMLLILMGENKMPDEQMCLGVRHRRD